MKLTNSQLKILLLESGILLSEQLDAAEKESKRTQIPLVEYLVESGNISSTHIGQVLANYYKVPYANLAKHTIDQKVLELIPHKVAKKQEVVLFKQDEEKAYVATTNPSNFVFFEQLKKMLGKEVEVRYADPSEFHQVMKRYQSDIADSITKLVDDLAKGKEKEEHIVSIIDLLMEYAYQHKASDIHIEPLDEEVSIRLRIDGVLHESFTMPKKLHEKLVIRLKIMSHMRTDEHAAAQDGRFSFDIEDKDTQRTISFDVRVSVLPTTEGENIVMRLLSDNSRRFTLADLGLMTTDLKKVEEASKKPYGMVLAVGPTGSGKTTTLYAVLQTLNRPEVNIMTIEDPVEFDMEHIQQTQVNLQKELTFAKGLRAIVRQDPDIVMVGEIRDEETSDIAINAAMTGHLVLSTLHANDASTTFPRLMDMGVEPFLVASGVNVIVAQRLIRTICEQCKISYTLKKTERVAFEEEEDFKNMIKDLSGKEKLADVRVYRGGDEKCPACAGTGYMGRSGIFEVLEMTDEVRSLITKKASSSDIRKKAVELGMKTMLQDGLEKVISGVTTVDEVLRAIKM
jgi:type II secretory ATPase GspE/PulE/Tfp pilus assembly ATPase PilB-like protein